MVRYSKGKGSIQLTLDRVIELIFTLILVGLVGSGMLLFLFCVLKFFGLPIG